MLATAPRFLQCCWKGLRRTLWKALHHCITQGKHLYSHCSMLCLLVIISNIWVSLGSLFFYTCITCVQVFHSSQLEQKLSWLQAHLFCQRRGANLLSITGPEEEHFVLQVLHEAFG